MSKFLYPFYSFLPFFRWNASSTETGSSSDDVSSHCLDNELFPIDKDKSFNNVVGSSSKRFVYCKFILSQGSYKIARILKIHRKKIIEIVILEYYFVPYDLSSHYSSQLSSFDHSENIKKFVSRLQGNIRKSYSSKKSWNCCQSFVNKNCNFFQLDNWWKKCGLCQSVILDKILDETTKWLQILIVSHGGKKSRNLPCSQSEKNYKFHYSIVRKISWNLLIALGQNCKIFCWILEGGGEIKMQNLPIGTESIAKLLIIHSEKNHKFHHSVIGKTSQFHHFCSENNP